MMRLDGAADSCMQICLLNAQGDVVCHQGEVVLLHEAQVCSSASVIPHAVDKVQINGNAVISTADLRHLSVSAGCSQGHGQVNAELVASIEHMHDVQRPLDHMHGQE